MLTAVPFGAWTPDLASTNSNHLVIAKNALPIANGYAPMGGFQTITSTLGAAFVGGGSFSDSAGVFTLLSATAAKLRKYASGAWTDILTVATTGRWYFAQFGDNIIYANGGQLGKYGLITGSAAVIANAPLNAIDVCTAKDFVMCLTADNQVKWSGFNDSTEWILGTDQCGNQPLLDGGPGVRIVGGEYAIILQKNCIRRAYYSGAQDIWWQFDVISPEIGCMAAGSVVNQGRLVFFLSERGFEMCNGDSVTPISDEKFNRWFFSTYSRGDIAQMWAAIDPRNALVMWGLPGSPGLIVCYNWILQRGTTIEVDVSAIFTGLTEVVSIDSLDGTYGDIDSVPYSLDSPMFAGGNPILMIVDEENVIGSLTGDSLEATFRQANIELTKGVRSRLRSVRPITDATNATAYVNSKMRAGDSESIDTAATMRGSGKMPIRANGRYYDVTLSIPAGETWSYATGLEYEYEAGDAR